MLAKEILCVHYWLMMVPFVLGNRPLVLNFGKEVAPDLQFIFKFDQFKRLIEEFGSVADFSSFTSKKHMHQVKKMSFPLPFTHGWGWEEEEKEKERVTIW